MNPALPKMWYIYMLINEKTKQIYIGCTNNLERRLTQHNSGQVFTTKKMLPLKLLYIEGYISRDQAYKRERSLKHYGSSLGKLKARIGIGKKGRAG